MPTSLESYMTTYPFSHIGCHKLKASEKSTVDLAIDYHDYQTDSLQSYAYKPALTTTLKANYNLGDKTIPQQSFLPHLTELKMPLKQILNFEGHYRF